MQPVLEDLQQELEEAAATLGASRWQTFTPRDPADPDAGAADRLRAGLRARARRVRLGDLHRRQHADGREITPLLIITKLEQYDYAGATAIAVVMLVASFVLLLVINVLQAWARARQGGCDERTVHALPRRAPRAPASRRARSAQRHHRAAPGCVGC